MGRGGGKDRQKREDEGRQREQPEVGPLELQAWALVLLCWR